MAQSIVFSEKQLERYYDRIELPKCSRHFTVVNFPTEKQFEILSILQKHQLAKIPFENLTLHYSWHRVIDLDPEHLFNKIVSGDGRGGYCMENNILFHVVLRSLGYSAYMVAARPHDRSSSRYGGLTHCLNIVILGSSRYAVDVCFGSRVPVLPLRLQDGVVQCHSYPGQMRARYDRIEQALCPDKKLWIYEHRKDSQASWVPQYCFADSEFLFDDIDCINWAPAKSNSSFFTQKVVVVRFTTENEVYSKCNIKSISGKANARNKAAIGSIDGALILDDRVFKWRKRGAVVWQQEIASEEERIDILSTYFSIFLVSRDIRAIRGTVAAITSLSRQSLQ